MKNIKTFESFEYELLNESLIDLIKMSPLYKKAKKIYAELKVEIHKYIKDNYEEFNKIKSKLSLPKIKNLLNEDYIFESEERKTELLSKVLKLLGIGFGSTGFISGLITLIMTAIEGTSHNTIPMLFVTVILMIFASVSYVTTTD